MKLKQKNLIEFLWMKLFYRNTVIPVTNFGNFGSISNREKNHQKWYEQLCNTTEHLWKYLLMLKLCAIPLYDIYVRQGI